MLTLPEELLLLSHDEKDGAFIDLPVLVLNVALVGAVLMDLALRDRIDTDLEKIMVVDPTPTGEPLLDGVLAQLADGKAVRSVAEWIDILRPSGSAIGDEALARLVERGILRYQADRILWVFETRRYPVIDGKQLQEVKLRIATLLMSDEIPDPRDIVIIALAQACGLLSRIFSDQELTRAQARIEQISRLDLVGQAMSSMMDELHSSLAMTRAFFS